jgi:hypothetical protein
MFACVLVSVTALGALAVGWENYSAPLPPQKDQYRLEGPFTQGNLTVFLVHGKDKIKDKRSLRCRKRWCNGR